MSTELRHVSVVLIHVDDVFRACLERALSTTVDLTVVASAGCGDDGVRALAVHPHAVAVIGPVALDEDGRAPLVEELRGVAPAAPVVMLIDAVEPSTVTAALRSGVAGIVRRGHPTLGETIRLAARRVCVFDPAALAVLTSSLTELPVNPLSARERQVLACLAEGLTNAEVAVRLFVSRETVKTHVAHVLRKLEADDRVAAVDKAIRIGLLA
ncbi:MAG: two component transcriptional regulator, LuxR family [Ilumatobacteraceae bacterium]|nr:two component transcriptional regulator, LuxR family [Ilumatobacteraceae bacterium]MCU1390903.1 two component transcriptional regulator, LuxR family [Ilumatobacteraceae bacterium]